MHEIDILRHSHLIDPHLHVWGWEVPLYLFLGGVAAGVMIVAGWLSRTLPIESRSAWSRALPLAVPALLSAGMLALFLDLEYKAHVYRFFLAFRPTSPMSWGSWVLLAVYPATALLGLGGLTAAQVRRWTPRPGQDQGWLMRLASWAAARRRGLGALNIVLGAALGVYTGILLSTLGTARPAWNSALLGPLFLVSGLSTGVAFTMLLPVRPDEHALLRRWDLAAIGLEAALLLLFFLGLLSSGGATGREAARLVLGGPYTGPFWAVVVFAGLLVPFVLEWIESARRLAPTRLAPLLVLAGGLALRWVVVLAGQA